MREDRLERVRRAREIVVPALRDLVRRIPALTKRFYWAGTAAVSYEETEHWPSIDIDLHSIETHYEIRPAVERVRALRGVRDLPGSDLEFGVFIGEIRLKGSVVPLDIKSSFEKPRGLVPSRLVPGLRREGLSSYLRNKVQCLQDRREPKDWLHLALLGHGNPRLRASIERDIERTADPAILLARLNAIETEPLDDLGIGREEEELLREFFDRIRLMAVKTARKGGRA